MAQFDGKTVEQFVPEATLDLRAPGADEFRNEALELLARVSADAVRVGNSDLIDVVANPSDYSRTADLQEYLSTSYPGVEQLSLSGIQEITDLVAKPENPEIGRVFWASGPFTDMLVMEVKQPDGSFVLQASHIQVNGNPPDVYVTPTEPDKGLIPAASGSIPEEPTMLSAEQMATLISK